MPDSVTGAGYFASVHVPMLPTLNSASNEHWTVKRKQHERVRIALRCSLTAGMRPAEPLAQATVWCVRYSVGPTTPDADNLAESFKPVLDELIRMGVIVDDSPAHVVVRYSRRRVTRRLDQGFRITIREGFPPTCPTCGQQAAGHDGEGL